jgi:L-fuculose-phosphate aldolase
VRNRAPEPLALERVQLPAPHLSLYITPEDVLWTEGVTMTHRKVGEGALVQIKDGHREKGKHPSRAVEIHQQIYKQHQHIGCIITTQAPNVTAYCVARQTFDNRTVPESYVFLRDIPLIPYGSQLGNTEYIPCKLSEETPILLIENDAIVITGRSLLKAYDRLEVAEFSARSIINSEPLGDIVTIDDDELAKLDEIARGM